MVEAGGEPPVGGRAIADRRDSRPVRRENCAPTSEGLTWKRLTGRNATRRNSPTQEEAYAYRKRWGFAEYRPVRDPQNPVKLRAENRARELGTTLGEIYQRTGVSRNYLTYYPKNGWREDRVRLVATALNWTVDELLNGPQYEREVEHRQHERFKAIMANPPGTSRSQPDVNLLEIAMNRGGLLVKARRPVAPSRQMSGG